MTETANMRRWRGERRVLTELLAHVERRGDPRLPWGAQPELTEIFADREAVLVALAARWSRALHGHLDEVFDLPDGERVRAVDRVAARLAEREPALHAVLLHHHDQPAVARARERDAERAGLARAAAHAEHVRPRYRVVDGAAVRTLRPVPTVIARAVAATARHCPVYRSRHAVASRAGRRGRALSAAS